MSEELKQRVEFVQNQFADFSNFIELPDFRSFLLCTLISQVPTNILAQMGLGGNKEVISLPYNPILKIYYQKINLISSGSLIIYVKSDPISEKFILEKDDSIIKKYLNSNEMSLAFRGKEKFLLPMVSDCSTCNGTIESKITVRVDDLFHSLESFMAVAEPNLLFVFAAKSAQDPDILFTFNMMPEMPNRTDQKVLKIDIFMDKEHNTKDITYIKREEDFIIKYLKDIKNVSHADIYKSAYSLLLHLKSFDKP